MTDHAPPRVNVLVPGIGELLETFAGILRDRVGATDTRLMYEAAIGELGAGDDPRGPDDLVRWIATTHVDGSWRLARSSSLPLGSPAEAHEDALVDAMSSLVLELGGPDLGLRR